MTDLSGANTTPPPLKALQKQPATEAPHPSVKAPEEQPAAGALSPVLFANIVSLQDSTGLAVCGIESPAITVEKKDHNLLVSARFVLEVSAIPRTSVHPWVRFARSLKLREYQSPEIHKCFLGEVEFHYRNDEHDMRERFLPIANIPEAVNETREEHHEVTGTGTITAAMNPSFTGSVSVVRGGSVSVVQAVDRWLLVNGATFEQDHYTWRWLPQQLDVPGFASEQVASLRWNITVVRLYASDTLPAVTFHFKVKARVRQIGRGVREHLKRLVRMKPKIHEAVYLSESFLYKFRFQLPVGTEVPKTNTIEIQEELKELCASMNVPAEGDFRSQIAAKEKETRSAQRFKKTANESVKLIKYESQIATSSKDT